MFQHDFGTGQGAFQKSTTEAGVNMLINTHCAPVLTKYEAPD